MNPKSEWKEKNYFDSMTVPNESWNKNYPVLNDRQGFRKFVGTCWQLIWIRLYFFFLISWTYWRIAFGGLHLPNQAVHYPLITKNALVRSSVQKYAMTFSSNSCLKWGMEVCQKATYFCCINGELIHFVKPALYEEANQDCNLRKGYLSKLALFMKISVWKFEVNAI